MEAKQVIVVVAVLAAFACVCSAVRFNDPESYWCYETHVARAAADGPLELTENNDQLCKRACKKERTFSHYLPGNWAIFEGKAQVKCCCSARKPMFGNWHYGITRPRISSFDLAHERADDIKKLYAYYDNLMDA